MWKSRNTDQARSDRTLPDRNTPIEISGRHFVTGASIIPPFPDGRENVLFGMGCFWGAEREFWLTEGVVATAVGYAGGATKHPSYEDVCSGQTGHTEAVLVVYNPKVVSFGALLKRFWEAHDPTQGMRQGPDRGSQYRSAIYTTTPAQQAEALASRERYSADLAAAGFGEITTEIRSATDFFYAEEYHQQYLARNLARGGIDPMDFYFGAVAPPTHPIAAEGYCGMQPTGVSCPIGLQVDPSDTKATT
jgi:peptide-methionine (S)-S-oxide reductase